MQNSQNQVKHSDNTSGFKGVSWHKGANKWVARIRVQKKLIHLGCFTTPEQAYAAYCNAANEHYKEYANNGKD
jgi:hypothetical protein